LSALHENAAIWKLAGTLKVPNSELTKPFTLDQPAAKVRAILDE
jgi:hypothetical protein